MIALVLSKQGKDSADKHTWCVSDDGSAGVVDHMMTANKPRTLFSIYVFV